MKWDNDPLLNEKLLLLDGIIKFLKNFDDKELSSITHKALTDFIDDFFKSKR